MDKISTYNCDSKKKKQKAKHNLIYRIRKAGQGRIDTRARMIYYFYKEKVIIEASRKHLRLMKEYGFGAQSELIK